MEKENILTATDYVNLRKENELLMNYNQDLIKQLKKQKEINQKAIEYIKNGDLLYIANKNSVVYRDNVEIKAVADRLDKLLQILEDKEV